MDAFGWEVVGSVAGVLAVAVGVLQFLQGRKKPSVPVRADSPGQVAERPAGVPANVSRVCRCRPGRDRGYPARPLGFQPRADLLAELDAPSGERRVSVVHAVTGMRGVGKTQLAAAYARARLAERWRLVAWVNAEDPGSVLGGLAAVAAALGLDVGTGGAGGGAGRCGTGWRSTGTVACWCSIMPQIRRICCRSSRRRGGPGADHQ